MEPLDHVANDNGMCAGSGWYGAVFAGVLVIALLLVFAALVKYLLTRAY